MKGGSFRDFTAEESERRGAGRGAAPPAPGGLVANNASNATSVNNYSTFFRADPGVQSLLRTSDRIEESKKIIHNSEEVAKHTLVELEVQRSQLHDMKGMVNETTAATGEAQTLLQKIADRAYRRKRLFEAAPPGSRENFFTWQRKVVYSLFAFGPGTAMAIYLESVKRDMEKEDERLKLQAIQNEQQTTLEEQHKDLALQEAMNDLRARLQALEDEARRARMPAATTATTSTSASTAPTQPNNTAKAANAAAAVVATPSVPLQAPGAEEDESTLPQWIKQVQDLWQQQRELWTQLATTNEPAKPMQQTAAPDESGIRARVAMLERERIQEDLRKHKAATATAAAAADK
ncbi:TPA: hypothetical protein N0F65_011479 [Lagenidium giganteum]|uniref:Peroxin-14 n=1 Tax=Lagenidium giganteum TaxID=4803 RepID=A0AAV2Z9G3_9STRA|nr:TPA: hypothetical protein N0F65_011479 [Lagenidium giganteum]